MDTALADDGLLSGAGPGRGELPTAKPPCRAIGRGRLVATVTGPDGNVLGLLQDR